MKRAPIHETDQGWEVWAENVPGTSTALTWWVVYTPDGVAAFRSLELLESLNEAEFRSARSHPVHKLDALQLVLFSAGGDDLRQEHSRKCARAGAEALKASPARWR